MVSQMLSMIYQFNLFVSHCVINFIQSFMVYKAVYQQQETGHGAHKAPCRIGTVSLS
jgi:hypothetical protein